MIDAVLDALIDSAKLLPFLFVTYLLMEYIEDKIEDKARAVLKKAGCVGPVWGALLGVIPQCGFSAAASNLYAGRIITMGTLIAIYLSTSDEMLPIFISEAVSPTIILKILCTKIIIGMCIGFIVDIVFTKLLKKKEQEMDIHHFCEHEHCACGQGILKPAIKHTLQIFLFVFIITLILNIVVEAVGLQRISDSVLNRPFIGEIIAGLIGLIPNCGASVMISSLYIKGVISFGTMMSGLLVGSGVGIMILLKVNGDRAQNATVISILFVSGVLCGILINLLGIAV